MRIHKWVVKFAAGVLCSAVAMATVPVGALTGLWSTAEGTVETEPYEVVFDSPEKLEGWRQTAYSKTSFLDAEETGKVQWTYDSNENALTNGAKDQMMPALTLENRLYDNFEAEIIFKKTNAWGHLVFMFGRTDDTKGCLHDDAATLEENGVGISISNNMGVTQDYLFNYQEADGTYGYHRYVSFPQTDNVGLIDFNAYNTLKVVVKNGVYEVYMNGTLIAKDGNALRLDNSQNPNRPGAGRIGILANDKCYVKSIKVTPITGEEETNRGTMAYENAFGSQESLEGWEQVPFNADGSISDNESIQWAYDESENAIRPWGNMATITLTGDAYQYKNFTAELEIKKTNTWGAFIFSFGRMDLQKSPYIGAENNASDGAAFIFSGGSGQCQEFFGYYQNAQGIFGNQLYLRFDNGTFPVDEYISLKVEVRSGVYSLYLNGQLVARDGTSMQIDNIGNPNAPERGGITLAANDNCYIRNLKITPIDEEALHIDPTLEEGERKTIHLDGDWLCQDMPFAAGLEQLPDEFTNSIPVPGLWDMAEKPFSYTSDREVVYSGNYEKKALWYKKTLVFDGEIPDTVTLKINKAWWGKYIYVNGQHVLTHQPNFTPAYVDISDHLKGNGEENVLLIKIGDFNSDPQTGNPKGYDGEREKCIPGIYDSVSLILHGEVMIDYVQAAPDIDKDQVKVQTTISNHGSADALTDVTVEIREKETGKLVVSKSLTGVEVPAGETVKALDILDMDDYRLWSPEDPFLYTVTSTVSGDSITQTFGMRKYRNNTEAGYVELNNEPIYLRGTNVVVFRFFEDPLRGDLPWDEDWVRSVLTKFKELNLNSLRVCVGFAPDFWYDLCDEMGILVDDEYSIFGNYGLPDTLGDPDSPYVDELRDWINERANHPSVVIWDVQNEMFKTEGSNPDSGNAIKILRAEGVDLSNRPFDNGWKPPVSSEDTLECHPYLFIDPSFRLSYLNETHPDPARYFGFHFNEEDSADPEDIPDNLRIINEYSWLWITRDGKPTKLTEGLYSQLFPDGYTEEELRKYYAMGVAQLTEFWRQGGYTAGIMEFCGLGYSRDGGYTSDNFLPDITDPQYHPTFKKLVGDAMAPVGICIEDWSEKHPTGRTKTFRVSILNQVNETFSGPVTLKLYQDGILVYEATKDYIVSNMEKGIQEFEVAIPEGKDSRFRLVASYVDENGDTVESLREFTDGEGVPAPGTADVVSIGADVTVSSTYDDSSLKPEHLVDGNRSTRWSTVFADDQWIQLDLGKVYELDTLSILWESGAPGKEFNVEVSSDGKHWTKVYEQTDGDWNKIDAGLHTAGRYVRINLLKRYTSFGFSIYEISVYGGELEKADTSALESLLTEAREVDLARLTEVSAQALREAIQQAEAALQAPTEETVYVARIALQTALDGREEKPAETTGITTSSGTSTQPSRGTEPGVPSSSEPPATGVGRPIACGMFAGISGLTAAAVCKRKRRKD